MRWIISLCIASITAVATAQESAPAPGPLKFKTITICNDFPSAYHCAVADLNKDGRPDIVVLGEPPGGVDWFENPGNPDVPWPRHIIAGQATEHNIDLAVEDVDRDGQLDVTIASDFLFGDSAHDSRVEWFSRPRAGADPPKWIGRLIHAVPTAHRIRYADFNGDGRNELLILPVIGRGAKPPGYQQTKVYMTLHWVPAKPAADVWSQQLIDNTLTVAHGMCTFDWNADGKCDVLTASNEGITLFITEGQGRDLSWKPRRLNPGHQGEAPNQGASEVEVARGPRGRFLASIEPWHGTEVVVYTPPEGGIDATGPWRRHVIDDSFHSGHALSCADLDGDGADEIVAGYRGEGTSLYVYRLADAGAGRWERLDLDKGGIAAQGCVTADVNGDGRTDIVAVGGSTHNAKLYLNQTPQRPKPVGSRGS